jgi:inosine-uridine nucleoside N-ribohydrolase
MATLEKKHKLIIDTDPGIDDAIALLLAINHPDIELIGLTTVFGNLATEGSTQNALDLLAQFDQPNIPVAKGADKPLKKVLTGYADFVHGANGLGNIEIPQARQIAESQTAAEFIVEQILKYPNEITICAIAPLTNLAKALELEPKIAKLAKQIVIMGGAIHVNGNITPVAEANIYNDPDAADQVLTAEWPVTLVGLDVTLKVILNDSLMQAVKNNSSRGELLYNISRFYDNFYRERDGFDGFACHDATALAYVTNPELFKVIRGGVRVSTEGLATGMTIVDSKRNYGETNSWSNLPLVNVCLDVNEIGIHDLLLKYLY